MKLSTNLKLFTKGYSLDDIKSLGEIEGMSDELALDIAEKGITLSDVQSLTELTVNDPVEVHVQDPEPTKETNMNEPDYKSLFEAEKAKVEELQKANVNTTVGNIEKDQKLSNFEIIENLFKNL